MSDDKLAIDHPVMIQIRDLSRTRSHRLAADLLGTRPLAPVQAARIRDHLQHQPLSTTSPAPAQRREEPVTRPAAPAPRREEPRRSEPIPDGRYAIDSLTGNNDLDFFEIKTPKDGKWAGFTFIERIIGGHDNVPERSRDRKRQILQAIRKMGAEASQLKAAQELGICMDCGQSLTDEESRRHGRGPKCRAKH